MISGAGELVSSAERNIGGQISSLYHNTHANSSIMAVCSRGQSSCHVARYLPSGERYLIMRNLNSENSAGAKCDVGSDSAKARTAL